MPSENDGLSVAGNTASPEVTIELRKWGMVVLFVPIVTIVLKGRGEVAFKWPESLVVEIELNRLGHNGAALASDLGGEFTCKMPRSSSGKFIQPSPRQFKRPVQQLH